MISKKAINQFRNATKDWIGVDYSKNTDEELATPALMWLGQNNSKKRYIKRKRTKLFYLTIARLQIARPDFITMMSIKTRFGIGYARTTNLIEELENTKVVKKNWLKPRKTNINWNIVNKIVVPKMIMEEAKKMKPMRGYTYSN